MGKQNCLRDSNYWKWNHLDRMTDGLLCSDLVSPKWLFSCLEGRDGWVRGGRGLGGGSFDFWKNMRCGTSAPPTGWFIGQRNKVAVGIWQGSSPFTSKGLFKWWPPPNWARWSKKYLKGILKGIFSLMYLVGFRKILALFSYISCFRIFIDIWNWQSKLMNVPKHLYNQFF